MAEETTKTDGGEADGTSLLTNGESKADGKETGENKVGESKADGKETGEQKADHKDGGTDDKSKDGEADKGKNSAPETYADFSVPEGVVIDAQLLPEFHSALKGLNATQEQAQALVDLQMKQMSGLAKEQQKAWAEIRETWKEAAQTDQEYGKGKFDESLSVARFAVRELGGPALAKALDETGMGDHPEIIRAFVKMGRAMKEDNITIGSGTRNPPKDAAEILYPNQGKK